MMTLVLLKGSTGTNRQTSKEGMMMLVLLKGCTGTNKQRGIMMMLVLLKGCTGTNKQRGNHDDDAGTVERLHRDK
jgi:hypothetical protein